MGGPAFPPGLSPIVMLYSRISSVENEVVRFICLRLLIAALLDANADAGVRGADDACADVDIDADADGFVARDDKLSMEVAFLKMDWAGFFFGQCLKADRESSAPLSAVALSAFEILVRVAGVRNKGGGSGGGSSGDVIISAIELGEKDGDLDVVGIAEEETKSVLGILRVRVFIFVPPRLVPVPRSICRPCDESSNENLTFSIYSCSCSCSCSFSCSCSSSSNSRESVSVLR